MPRSRGSQGGEHLVIHNRLPMLRAERGWSRKHLAELIGVNYQTIGYLERGDFNPSLELAFRLSSVFERPIEAIFSTEPFQPLSAAQLTEEHP
jgi:DNA-binding XRE family transcriptional regulator